MLSNLAIGYIIAGILAVIGGGVRQYLAYRYGRKTQEGIYKDAVLKKTLELHKKDNEVETKPAGDFNSGIDRL